MSSRTMVALFALCSLTACFGRRIGNVDYYVSPKEFELTMNAHNGGDPNKKDEFGRTPIMLSTVTCFYDVTSGLVGRGADVNARDAAGHNVLSYLFRGRDNEHTCPDDVRLFDLFVSKGVDVKGEVGGGFSAVHEASRAGNATIVDKLIASGLDVNAREKGKPNGRTPLHLAANVAVATSLLKAGADINAVWDAGYGQLMPLDSAIVSGRPIELAEFIKSKGGKTTGFAELVVKAAQHAEMMKEARAKLDGTLQSGGVHDFMSIGDRLLWTALHMSTDGKQSCTYTYSMLTVRDVDGKKRFDFPATLPLEGPPNTKLLKHDIGLAECRIPPDCDKEAQKNVGLPSLWGCNVVNVKGLPAKL